MLRALLLAVALTGLACGRDEGPTTPTVSESGKFASLSSSGGDDDEFDGGRGAPQSDHVMATVVMSRLHSKWRECQGKDGYYFEDHGVWYGKSSGDPRLTGDFELRLILDLFNATVGGGPQYGNVVIRDPVTRRKKAEGVSSAWGINLVRGTIVGIARDDGGGAEETSGSGRLVAGFEFRLRPDGGVNIQIGGPATDNVMHAGIWSGRCSGKFSEADYYFPDPEAGSIAARTSERVWSRGTR